MPACTKYAAEPEANEGTLGREKCVLCVVCLWQCVCVYVKVFFCLQGFSISLFTGGLPFEVVSYCFTHLMKNEECHEKLRHEEKFHSSYANTSKEEFGYQGLVLGQRTNTYIYFIT